MAIPFYLQYDVEYNRNSKFQWMNFGLQLLALILYGLIFQWIPIYLRNKRTSLSQTLSLYFKGIRVLQGFNKVYRVNLPWIDPLYIQPSLVGVYIAFITFLTGFVFVDINDLDYQTRDYIIAKRLSRMAISNFPILYLLVIKNDLVTATTGLTHDRLVLLHKWIARTMFVMICVHVYLSIHYWLHLGFKIMIIIPPQIFGFIAFGSFFILTFGSLKFIRKWAYDFFLIEHRVFSFIMLLFALFHNVRGMKGSLILAVHQFVLDRVISRVVTFVQKRQSPTKRISKFELLDDRTIMVTVPLNSKDYRTQKWWQALFPNFNTWKPGQHVYLNVPKVSWMQQHPFTIASLSDTKEMKFVLRVQKGFTRLLKKKISELNKNDTFLDKSITTRTDYSETSHLSTAKNEPSNTVFVETELTSSSTDIENNYFDDDDVTMKAIINGPFGATYQPLISFDSTMFFAVGLGASFTFPVCLDLLQTIQTRNDIDDYLGRPLNSKIQMVWVIPTVDVVGWYEFILAALADYCSVDMLELNIYITRENDGKFVSSVENKNQGILSVDNILVFEGRPNISGLIDAEATRLTSRTDMKSLAVLSCGPTDFGHSIKESCRCYKWSTDAPDIYCYTESFD